MCCNPELAVQRMQCSGRLGGYSELTCHSVGTTSVCNAFSSFGSIRFTFNLRYPFLSPFLQAISSCQTAGATSKPLVTPELPDIAAYITALEPRIVGEPIEHVRVASPFLLRTVEPP